MCVPLAVHSSTHHGTTPRFYMVYFDLTNILMSRYRLLLTKLDFLAAVLVLTVDYPRFINISFSPTSSHSWPTVFTLETAAIALARRFLFGLKVMAGQYCAGWGDLCSHTSWPQLQK